MQLEQARYIFDHFYTIPQWLPLLLDLAMEEGQPKTTQMHVYTLL
jgi:hypothetical protein